MPFHSPSDVYTYLQSFIPNPPKRFGHFGLERTQYLAEQVGNPQDTYPVIHIAGTSGKGSTAYMTSRILQAQGLKVGLHVSPHLLDFRERMQVNHSYMTDDILFSATERVVIAVEKCTLSQYGKPSYYEVAIVLAYTCFALAKVDVAVVEVGLGGVYDGSNIMTRNDKISIITRQGYDHQETLGDTLEEIATNDVGIILPQSHVVALEQDEDICNTIIADAAKQQSAEVHWVLHSSFGPSSVARGKNPDDNTLDPSLRSGGQIYGNIYLENAQTIFDYTDTHGLVHPSIHLVLLGLFQAENAALALTAAELFCEKNTHSFDWEKAQAGLLTPGFRGRCDVRTIQGRTVILDGAHNPQKMQALVDTLRTLYPHKNIVRYMAYKQGKDRQSMLDIMQGFSNHFVCGAFTGSQDMSFASIPIENIHHYLTQYPDSQVKDCPNPEIFFSHIHDYATDDEIIVVTGSLYRLSRVYKGF